MILIAFNLLNVQSLGSELLFFFESFLININQVKQKKEFDSTRDEITNPKWDFSVLGQKKLYRL